MPDFDDNTLQEGWEQARQQAMAKFPGIDDAALFDLRNAFYLGAMRLNAVMNQAGSTKDDSIGPLVRQELFAFMTRGQPRPTPSPSRHLIGEGWLDAKRRIVPNNAGPLQAGMVEQLYYCGAIHTMHVVDRAIKIGDSGNPDVLLAELTAFLADLKAYAVSTTPRSQLQWLARDDN